MSPVQYMQRIREYYLDQGYEKPYTWAHFEDVPFTPLKKPLSESVVTLFSTSDVSVRRDEGEILPATETTVGEVYSVPWNTPIEELYSRQESFDHYATSLDDIDAYLDISTRCLSEMQRGRRRHSNSDSGLTRVPPDRESGRTPPGREWHTHRYHWRSAGYCRTLRRIKVRIRGLSTGKPLWRAVRQRYAKPDHRLGARSARRSHDAPQHFDHAARLVKG